MPEVSVVIPVYKVEQYLEECLNSVRAQTLRDIEIICVNDGSPDRCPQILDEYAAEDSRIIVIHKENGGLSSARNAAYPYIRSVYTLFVDSDDSIEPTLCEKTVAVANRKSADMTFFIYLSRSDSRLSLEYYRDHEFVADEAQERLFFHFSACGKLWRSKLLLDHDLKFPEGLCFEDVEVHVRALLLNPRIALVPEKLYQCRASADSITRNNDSERTFDIFPVTERVKGILVDANQFKGEWKRRFLQWKLAYVYNRLMFVSERLKPRMLEMTKAMLGDDEREFLAQSPHVGRVARQFYRSLLGYPMADVQYWTYKFLCRTRTTVVKIIPTLEGKLRRAG